MQMLSNIIFGLFCGGVCLAFGYYVRLQNAVSGHIICEYWGSSGHRRFILCKIKREILIDQAGVEIPEEEAAKLTPDQKKCAQVVAELEISSKDKKKYPELAQATYYTRRDIVDDCSWPIGSPIPIHVPARICSWEVGSSEPIDPREEHRKLPITSSPGFASGVREHDMLLQGGAMIESMQHFFEDVNNKFSQIAKGALNKNYINIIAIILGILVLVSVGASIFIIMKLQGLGI
jgi:hypothetical protein